MSTWGLLSTFSRSGRLAAATSVLSRQSGVGVIGQLAQFSSRPGGKFSSNNRRLLRSKLMNKRRGRDNNSANRMADNARRSDEASWPQAKFGLRRNVPITVLPGNFNDYRKADNEDLHEDLRPEPDILNDTSTTVQDEYKMVEKILKKQEEIQKAIKERNVRAYNTPKVFKTKINERGQSYSRGGRKSSTARVWIQPGLGEIVVNKQDYSEYFLRESHREHLLEPFVVTGTVGQFDVTATVRGGGHTGQAGAIRYGIAYCLQAYNPDLYRPPLRYKGLLTRDARRKERKKTGLVKARKAPQWVRR